MMAYDCTWVWLGAGVTCCSTESYWLLSLRPDPGSMRGIACDSYIDQVCVLAATKPNKLMHMGRSLLSNLRHGSKTGPDNWSVQIDHIEMLIEIFI